MSFTLERYLIEVLRLPEPTQPFHGTFAQNRGFQLRKGQWKRCTQTGLVTFESVWMIPEPGGEVVEVNPKGASGSS